MRQRVVMAAYGLYTHIAANKKRSMMLLAGLFLLVYVIVYAGGLIREVMNNGNATCDYYLKAAPSGPESTRPLRSSSMLPTSPSPICVAGSTRAGVTIR